MRKNGHKTKCISKDYAQIITQVKTILIKTRQKKYAQIHWTWYSDLSIVITATWKSHVDITGMCYCLALTHTCIHAREAVHEHSCTNTYTNTREFSSAQLSSAVCMHYLDPNSQNHCAFYFSHTVPLQTRCREKRGNEVGGVGWDLRRRGKIMKNGWRKKSIRKI